MSCRNSFPMKKSPSWSWPWKVPTTNWKRPDWSCPIRRSAKSPIGPSRMSPSGTFYSSCVWHVLIKSIVHFFSFSGIKHTLTLSSLKSSPSVLSTFKDIASLYSPMKELGPDDEGYRFKPKHHALPVISDEESSTANNKDARGPDDSLLWYCSSILFFNLNCY